MEFLSIFDWLIKECHAHNASYHYVTDKVKLSRAEAVCRTLQLAYDDNFKNCMEAEQQF